MNIIDKIEKAKPFIIAEIGSNWTTFQEAKDSIAAAQMCGADAVKFQLYTHEALYGSCGAMPGMLPPEWLPLLKEKAQACGIEFMCSAFSPELIDVVNPYVNIHKVASAELTHVGMLMKLREIGKPVILSTGASGSFDIRESLKILRGNYTNKPACHVILMYCVAAYPAQEVDLDNLGLIGASFHVPVGFSDHTTNVAPIPKLAAERGASVIEKHFSAIDACTPDQPHSLNPPQFKRMVDHIRGNVKPVLGATRDERSMILKHNRRLIATRDVAQSEMLVEGKNFGIYRSLVDDSHGFSPFLIWEINGKHALKALKAGQAIGPGDV